MNKRILIVGAPPMIGLGQSTQELLKEKCEIISIDEANERGITINRKDMRPELIEYSLIPQTQQFIGDYESGKEKRRVRRSKGKQKLKVKKLC